MAVLEIQNFNKSDFFKTPYILQRRSLVLSKRRCNGPRSRKDFRGHHRKKNSQRC